MVGSPEKGFQRPSTSCELDAFHQSKKYKKAATCARRQKRTKCNLDNLGRYTEFLSFPGPWRVSQGPPCLGRLNPDFGCQEWILTNPRTKNGWENKTMAIICCNRLVFIVCLSESIRVLWALIRFCSYCLSSCLMTGWPSQPWTCSLLRWGIKPTAADWGAWVSLSWRPLSGCSFQSNKAPDSSHSMRIP